MVSILNLDKKSPQETGKLQVVTPEISDFLPGDSPAGATLYFSTKALRNVKRLCSKRRTIVVADELTKYVANICNYLACPFYGSMYTTAQQIQLNPLMVHDWLREGGIPMTRSLDLPISDVELFQELQRSHESWQFRQRDSHRMFQQYTNVSKDKVDSFQPDTKLRGILISNPASHFENYGVIEIGIQIEVTGNWKLVATTEKKVYLGSVFGNLIPQCTIGPEILLSLTQNLVGICYERKLIGYATFSCIAWQNPWVELINKGKIEFKVSDFFPYLTLNILKAAALAVKCKLATDSANFAMVLNNSTSWDISRLDISDKV